MTVRHALRHIEMSTKDAIAANLVGLGWNDSTDSPFNARVQVTTAATGLPTLTGSAPSGLTNPTTPTVQVSVMGQNPDDEIEIGGSNIETRYDIFVSVFAEPPVALALVDDILGYLAGRTVAPVIPFTDYAADAPVDDETLELEDVSAGRANPDRRDWLLITGTIVRNHRRSWT
jgi:hypothetical protein